MDILSKNIYEERKTKGLTQEELAKKLGLPVNTYGNWERGHSEPPAEMLVKLANLFECSVDYLLGRANAIDVVNIQTDLTAQQKELLSHFDRLNDVGKARLLGYLFALLDMPANVRR